MVGYREIPFDGTSFIETQNGDALLARGRFWIEPTSGRLVRSELVTGDARVELTAHISVDYGWFPSVNLWLPARMHEAYEATDASRRSPTITGSATCSNYRLLTPALGSLTVAWDRSVDPGVVGYVVEWGEASGNYGNAKDVGNASRFKIDHLVEGRRYYVIVQAYTADHTISPPSNELSDLAKE